MGSWPKVGSQADALPTLSAGTWREEAALGWQSPREGVVPPSWLCQVPPTAAHHKGAPKGFPLCHPQPLTSVPNPAEPALAWVLTAAALLGGSRLLGLWDGKVVPCLQAGEPASLVLGSLSDPCHSLEGN